MENTKTYSNVKSEIFRFAKYFIADVKQLSKYIPHTN